MGERAKVRRQLSGRIGVTFNPTPARVILNRPLLNLMSARSRDLDEVDDPPAGAPPPPPAAEQPLSPSAEQPPLLTGDADGAGAVSKADVTPNRHAGALEDLPKCASDSEGRSVPPGNSVGRAVTSKSVQIDVIPGRLLLHPKLQARLEEEPDRFREGPIERRLSDTPPWLQAAATQQHAHASTAAASSSECEPDAAHSPQSKRSSARERFRERDPHSDAAPDAEASGRHASYDAAQEGAAQPGTAGGTAEEKEPEGEKEKEAAEENALAMLAHEKRAKSAMGGALALLPPREVWEKKIDFLLSVIGFAVDFANMYVRSVQCPTARGSDILLLLGSVHLSLILRSNYIVR